jgi:hypothetical protein
MGRRHSLSIAEICQAADRTADTGLFGGWFANAAARRTHRAVDHFVHLVYAIDERVLAHWSPAERRAIDGAIQTAIAHTEAFLDSPASRRSTRLAQHLAGHVYRLRVAAEGIALGLAANPERRPFGWETGRHVKGIDGRSG